MTVAETGLLPLTGALTSGEVSIAIGNARLESPTPGAIAGTFEQTWTLAGATGMGILGGEIRSMSRVSGGPTVLLRRPATEPLSLEEAVRRVMRQ